MKKLIFFAVCLLLAGEASAQRYRTRRVVRRPPPPPAYHNQHRQANDFYRVKTGFKAGVNFANTIDAYNGDFSTNTLTGFNAGLTLEVPIIYPLSFAPEILYSQKGYSASTRDGDFRQRNNFIDVPLLAKVRLGSGFSLVAGPQLSFLVSSKNSYRNGFITVIDDRYDYAGNKTLLGGVVGLSVDVSRSVDIHARYTIDIQDSNTDAYSLIPDYRNQVWQVGIGIKFR